MVSCVYYTVSDCVRLFGLRHVMLCLRLQLKQSFVRDPLKSKSEVFGHHDVKFHQKCKK
jgi:hypothetical protein